MTNPLRWIATSLKISLLAAFGLDGGGVCVTASVPAAARPNILFIYADDQPYKSVGCYPGSWPWVKTPNIDALAKSGIRFDAAYLGSWCMPSRATMLTGRHPHGIESMRLEGKYPGSTYDPAQTRFFPAEFRKAGYHTAQIGKWHTGSDTGFGRDWDRQMVWNHAASKGGYYSNQIVSVDGREQRIEGYSTDNYTKWAVEYIRGAGRDPAKPWYLWLCYGAVHGPSTPAARHQGRYKNAEVQLPADVLPPRPGKPAYLEKTQSWARNEAGEVVATRGDSIPASNGAAKRPPTLAEWVQRVNECALAVDEGVADLVQALRDSGQFENTLIVYTADQGFAIGEHGMRTKVAPYDANYRSPLIIAMPSRFPPGKVCETAVNGPDLVATFCATGNVTVPWKLHGRDLTPLLQNPASDWPHPTLYQHVGGTYGREVGATLKHRPETATYAGVPWYAAVAQNRFKFIHYLQLGTAEELYDLRHDPDELRNLAGDRAHASRVSAMRAALAAELARTDAGFDIK